MRSSQRRRQRRDENRPHLLRDGNQGVVDLGVVIDALDVEVGKNGRWLTCFRSQRFDAENRGEEDDLLHRESSGVRRLLGKDGRELGAYSVR